MAEAYSELLVEVLPEMEEAASAVLFEAGAGGVEIRDEANQGLAVDFPRAEGAIIVLGYFEPMQAFEHLEFVKQHLGLENMFRLEARRGLEVDWVKRFREHFRPLEISDHLLILPAWIQPTIDQLQDKLVIRIEPGPAFGTGQHPTTMLCLEYIQHLADRNELAGKLLDVGAGSGILGVAAVMLGMEGAIGVEIDQAARVWARRNIALNNLKRKVLISHKSITAMRGSYPVVVANIHTSVLLEILPLLVQRMAPEGKLILSGILDVEEQTMLEACRKHKLRLISRREKGEWVALLLN